MIRGLAIGAIAILLLLALFTLFQTPVRPMPVVSFSEFINELDKGRVRHVTMQDSKIVITFTDNAIATTSTPNYPTLVQRLLEKNVEIVAGPPDQPPWQITLLISWLPFIVWMGVIIWFTKSVTGPLTAPDGRRIAELMSESTSQSKQLNEKIERMMSDYEQRLTTLEKKQQP
jgi:cell division protease FtsH